jgi:hypothetical protein
VDRPCVFCLTSNVAVRLLVGCGRGDVVAHRVGLVTRSLQWLVNVY